MWSPVRFIRICETNVCISVFRNRNSKNLSLDCKHFSLPVFDSRILIFAITRTKLYKHWCQIILGLKLLSAALWHAWVTLKGPFVYRKAVACNDRPCIPCTPWQMTNISIFQFVYLYCMPTQHTLLLFFVYQSITVYVLLNKIL